MNNFSVYSVHHELKCSVLLHLLERILEEFFVGDSPIYAKIRPFSVCHEVTDNHNDAFGLCLTELHLEPQWRDRTSSHV